MLAPGHHAATKNLVNRASRSLLNSWPGFWVVPWLVPALTSIYLKYLLMAGTVSYGSGGFKIAAQSLGRTSEFGLWEKMSFFQVDVIVAALSPEVRSGDVVAILSNGGFGGIYQKLPRGITEAAIANRLAVRFS